MGRVRSAEEIKQQANTTTADPVNWLLIGFVFGISAAVSFAIYYLTLFPSVPGGDAGEMITIAYQVGVPHPPGYPLFTMLGKAFTFLPFGSIAWRINLSAAVCGAIGNGFLGSAVALWTDDAAAALLAAGLFGFSPSVWLYSIQGEVFALNNLFVCWTIFLSVLYCKGRQMSVAYLGALVLGLGLTNQHTTLLSAVPLAVGILWIGRSRLLNVRGMCMLALNFLTGFVPPYLYLFHARWVNGGWGNTTSLSGFFKHVLRQEYGTFQLGSTEIGQEGLFMQRLEKYVEFSCSELLYLGPFVALVGCVSALYDKRTRVTALLLGGSWVVYVLVFTRLANLPLDKPLMVGVQMRFWMQPSAFVALMLGHGAHRAFEAARSNKCGMLCHLLAAAVVAVQVARNFEANDNSQNTAVSDYGKSILDSMPQDSMVLLVGDIIVNSVRYLQQCEGRREDVRAMIVPTMTWRWFQETQLEFLPDVTFPGTHYHTDQVGGYSMLKFVEANRGKFKNIFLCGEWYSGDSSAEQMYALWPHGFCKQLMRRDRAMPFKRWAKRSTRVMPNFDLPDPIKYGVETWEFNVHHEMWRANHSYAHHALIHAIESHQASANKFPAEQLQYAFEAYMVLVRDHPTPAPDYFHKNLGIVASRMASDPTKPQQANRMTQLAVEHFSKYVELSDGTDKDLEQIHGYLKQVTGR